MTIYTAVTILFILIVFLGASLSYLWRQQLRQGHAHDQLAVKHATLDTNCVEVVSGNAVLVKDIVAVINNVQDRMDKLEKYVEKETTWV